LNVLKVKGRSDLFLKLEVYKKVIFLFIIVAGFFYGIFFLLWGTVLFSCIAFWINTYYTAKFIQYTALEQIIDIAPYILIAMSTGGIVFFLKFYLPITGNNLTELLIG
jgi:hypothetical protein